MITLAFNTASPAASVAILRNRDILYETIIHKELNHSEVLLPAIDEACLLAGIKLSAMDLFACTLGPGSFTGLRIGVSTLKGLMMATGKPATGVSSLTALALNVHEKGKIIGAMMDAGRGQVYLAYYKYDQDGSLQELTAAKALDPQSISCSWEEEVIYVGDGAMKYADLLRSFSNSKTAPDSQQFICASAVGMLALEKYRRNELLDLAGCVPVYLRPADALPKKQGINYADNE